MASAPSAAVQAALLAPASIVTRRVEIYEADAVTRWTQDDGKRLITGAVNLDSTRDERRTVDLFLDNKDSLLRHSPAGFWYDKIIRPYRGVIWDGGSWEIPLGDFMIDRIDSDNFPYGVKVTGRDFTKKLILSKFGVPTGFNQGASIENTIQTIATNGGITKFIFPVTGRTLGRDFIFEAGTTRWEAITQIASAYGYELFFDNLSFLVLREYQDPSTSPLAYTFKTGKGGSVVRWGRQVNDSRIYNVIQVTGGAADTVPPIYAEARNTNVNSPTRIALIGERVYRYTSAFITTTAQAQDVANKFLKVHALEEFELGMESITLPWIEAGEIIEFKDPDALAQQPDRFLLSSLNIPLGLEAMPVNGKRVSIVG